VLIIRSIPLKNSFQFSSYIFTDNITRKII